MFEFMYLKTSRNSSRSKISHKEGTIPWTSLFLPAFLKNEEIKRNLGPRGMRAGNTPLDSPLQIQTNKNAFQ